jgi:hypothetical protein
MKAAIILGSIGALLAGGIVISSGPASAVDYSDVTAPSVASLTFSPARAVRGTWTTIEATLVLVDDKSPTSVQLVSLMSCNFSETGGSFGSSVPPDVQLLERSVNPSTGQVTDTWLVAVFTRDTTPAGNYFASIMAQDDAGNRIPSLYVGQDSCSSAPVFVIDPVGSTPTPPVEPIANRLVALTAQVDSLTAENSRLTQERDRTIAERDEALREVAELQTQVSTLTEERDAALKANDTTKKQIASLQAKYKKALALIKKLQSRN